jgi:integrase
VLAFVVIGLETAMRRSEILSIRREHVDLDRLTLFIPKAKAGSREQPFTRRLAEFLRAYLATLAPDEQWLFPCPASATGHATDIRKGFRRAVAAAGLDPDQIVRHTLRHTAITHLVQAGVDLPTVKRISGHKKKFRFALPNLIWRT